MLTLRRIQGLFLGMLLIAGFLVAPTPSAAAASDSTTLYTMYVSATSAPVRSRADTTTGYVRSTLPWGSKVLVTPFRRDALGNITWYRVGTGRYIEAKRLDPVKLTDPAVAVRWSKAVWRYMQVRSGPGFWYPVADKMAGFERVVGAPTASDLWIKLGEQRYVYKGSVSPFSNLAELNGRMPADQICALPSYVQGGGSSVRINCAIIGPLLMMDRAFYKEFGKHLNISNSYRTYEWQANCYSQENSLCAAPGTSMHGWGMAVDFRGTDYAFDTPVDRWLTQYGLRYGWDRPVALDKGSATPEYWHYNFVG